MELFLNLCWLSLLLPAFLLWRQRTSSATSAVFGGSNSDSKTSKAEQSLVLLCTLGCAFVLLFPVISATDDLHAMRPEMEESERTFRHAGTAPCALHALAYCSQPALPAFAFLTPIVEQIDTVSQLPALTGTTSPAPAPAGRAPPVEYPTSL